MEKSCLRWDSNPRPPDFVADALPGWATAADDILNAFWFWDCVRNAAMRFIANENVALSAIAVNARQPALPTNRPALL